MNRLRQVTSAIKQDGANQVSIITSTAERQAAIEFAKAAAMRPQIVGAALQRDQRGPGDRGGAVRGARDAEAARGRSADHAGAARQRPARANAGGVDQERKARSSSGHELTAAVRASSGSRAGNGRGSCGPLPSGSRRSALHRRRMNRDARIQIVLSTTSNQQFGLQAWLMNRAMLPFTAASRLHVRLTRKTQMAPFAR